MNTKEEFKKQLIKLYDDGQKLLEQETIRDNKRKEGETKKRRMIVNKHDDFPSIQISYNKWYTVALPLIKLLARDRYDDFISYYKIAKRKPGYYTTIDYTISDYLNNDKSNFMIKLADWDNFNEFEVFSVKFQNQLAILNACIENIDSILFDIENVLQYNMYKSELEAAADLLRTGFIRPAGTLAGVVLERYLKEACIKYEIKLSKKKPTMADYNDTLKDNGKIDQATWRKIQFLGDIRNYCAHSKEREPRKDEVEDLISGVEKIIVEVA
jgi:hypothetical protein